jgi:hypothetical protein
MSGANAITLTSAITYKIGFSVDAKLDLDLQGTVTSQGWPHLQLMATDIPLLVSALHSALLQNAHFVASQLHIQQRMINGAGN